MPIRCDPLAILRQARSLTGSVLVGLSGGKDSLAVLDLACEHFDRVSCYFLCTVPGLAFQERMLAYCERRYGITVHRLPHWVLSHQLREWAFRGPTKGDVPRLKLLDVENEARKLAGIQWIATGQRKADSLERRAMLSQCGGISEKSRRFYPLAEWSTKHVWAYLRRRRIPLPPDYRLFGRSWGGRLHAEDLLAIRQAFPEDYAKITRYFPHVEAQIVREEIRLQRAERDARADAEPAPGLPDGAAGPLADQGG